MSEGLVSAADSLDASQGAAGAGLDRVQPRRHALRIDFSERHSVLLALARALGDFDVDLERLAVGDYFLDAGVLVERKAYADFAMSLVDCRLFP